MPGDVKGDVVDFLKDNINYNNLTVEFGPTDVDFADYDSGLDLPGVYVQTENTVVPGSGSTGYTGFDPGSGGPTQDPVTTVQVDCWGGDVETQRLQDAGVHPDEFAANLGWEVWKACLNNSQGPDGYRFISVSEPTENNDTEASPTKFRRLVPVSLGYHISPD